MQAFALIGARNTQRNGMTSARGQIFVTPARSALVRSFPLCNTAFCVSSHEGEYLKTEFEKTATAKRIAEKKKSTQIRRS